MIPDEETRAQWREVTQAHERLVVSFRALIAARDITAEHEAKQGLLGSLIAMGFTVKEVSATLLTVDLRHGNDEYTVEELLPSIIDIESEEDEDHRPSE